MIRDFSKGYLRLKSRKDFGWEREERLVKNAIAEIIKSDIRYSSGIDSFEILSRFERF